jgi:hypothetical protein
MGRHQHSMTHSPQLAELLGSFEEAYPDYELSESADMTSTSGYDNDGSCGPELVDNGVSLAFACRDYDPEATVFWADDNDNTTYYVFGKTEDDAIRRFRETIGSDEGGQEALRIADAGGDYDDE